MEQHPNLFEGRLIRPIVRDLQIIADYAVQHDLVLGVAVETPQVLFVIDLVESKVPDERVHRHPYLRVISCGQLRGGVNVAILATIENNSLGRVGDIVLVNQERHALGGMREEIPRGFGESATPGEIQALNELETETGLSGELPVLLGATQSDSGLMDSVVFFYHVRVTKFSDRRPEREEAIENTRLVSRSELWHDIRSGRIQDSFTLQALALYEESLIQG
jgi:ADP-ribose pyrophosphatase